MTAFPLRHLSVRVPWHDAGWAGVVCSAPHLNGACAKLKRISGGKKEEAERDLAGKSLCGFTGGWHIMPVVDMDDSMLTLLFSARADGQHCLLSLPKTELIRIHNQYEGGDDIAYLESSPIG